MRQPDRHTDATTPPLWLARRIAWFVGLWSASVAALAIVAYGIRWWLGL